MTAKMTVESFVPDFLNEFDRVAAVRMNQATQEARTEVIDTLSQPGSGETYRVPGSRVTYKASAEGEPPAVRLGLLRQSIEADMVRINGEIFGRVGVPDGPTYPDGQKIGDVAMWLQFGTSKMAPRPFLDVALDRASDRIKHMLSVEWF